MIRRESSAHPGRAAAGLLAALLISLGCSGLSRNDLSEIPSAEDLYNEGVALVEKGGRIWKLDITDYEKAIDRFQSVIDNYPYSDYAVLSELRIADAYFQQKRWDEALAYYREFGELHPDHEKVPYTIFRSALCYTSQSLKPERDQTATREALATLDLLISRYPRAPEVEQAERMWKELRTRLGRHELIVGDFYMKHKEHQSAANRYRTVLNDYPGLGLDAEALYKLGVAYTQMNRNDEAQEIFEVILRNYEDSQVAEGAAAGLVPAAN